MDLEDRLRLLQMSPQTGVLLAQLLVLGGHRIATTALRPPGLGQRFERPFSAGSPPRRQVRGEQALASQQRADRTRLPACIRLFQYPQLILRAEVPTLRLVGNFRVGTR